MAATSRWSMPDEVRQLRGDWPSQMEKVPNLTEQLEKDFRFGQRISKTDRGYVMGGSIKGGSSSMWYPSNKDHYKAYNRWRELEGVVEGRDDAALERLQTVLRPHGIELVTRHPKTSTQPPEEPYHGFGPVYRITASVLEALPPSHLARPSLRKIQIGGWGPDSAKASAYHASTVMMYEFAIRGARRTFSGLLLHELGHAHEASLEKPQLAALRESHQLIAEADALVGVEFLLEPGARIQRQKFLFEEFLAETYMIYTACGVALREFVARQEPLVRAAWEHVYDFFRETFGGAEYE